MHESKQPTRAHCLSVKTRRESLESTRQVDSTQHVDSTPFVVNTDTICR